MEELKMICAVIVSLSSAAAIMWRIRKKFYDVVEGILCQLRSEMLRTYYRHRDERKIRQYEMENFEHNYRAYTALGGNSFVGTIHAEVITWKVIT